MILKCHGIKQLLVLAIQLDGRCRVVIVYTQVSPGTSLIRRYNNGTCTSSTTVCTGPQLVGQFRPISRGIKFTGHVNHEQGHEHTGNDMAFS